MEEGVVNNNPSPVAAGMSLASRTGRHIVALGLDLAGVKNGPPPVRVPVRAAVGALTVLRNGPRRP